MNRSRTGGAPSEGLPLVRDVMVTDVKTVGMNSPVIEVVRKMNEFRIGSIVVDNNNNNKSIGIVTEGDILRRVEGPQLNPTTTKVRDIMTVPVHTVRDDISIEETARTN